MPIPPGQRSPRRPLAATLVLIVLASLVTSCGLFDDPNAADPTLPTPPEADIAYGPVAGCDGPDGECGGSQTLDIYRSDEPGPNPVLVYFHGGGFVEGDKEASVSEELQALLDDGWDIVSVNYRLSTTDGANTFPAAVQDAKRAVRWVKANAAAQDWDASNVAAMGHSAGGNLVAMLGVTADEADLEPTDLPPDLAQVDSSVIAVIALNPVMDLTLFGANPDWNQWMRQYTGCSGDDCAAAFQRGSVQNHVDPGAVPMLSMHGQRDPLAPPPHGVLVQDQYDRAGIGDRFELVVVDDGPERYQGHRIDYERFTDRFADFLDQYRS